MLAHQSLNRLVDIAKSFKLTKQTGRSFHVAFVLQRRKVVSVGFNNFAKSNFVCHNYKPTRNVMADDYRACVHAEIDATSKFRGKDVKKLILVSLRIDNHNRLAYAQPCPNCAYHLGKMGFVNIIYSDKSGQFTEMN